MISKRYDINLYNLLERYNLLHRCELNDALRHKIFIDSGLDKPNFSFYKGEYERNHYDYERLIRECDNNKRNFTSFVEERILNGVEQIFAADIAFFTEQGETIYTIDSEIALKYIHEVLSANGFVKENEETWINDVSIKNNRERKTLIVINEFKKLNGRDRINAEEIKALFTNIELPADIDYCSKKLIAVLKKSYTNQYPLSVTQSAYEQLVSTDWLLFEKRVPVTKTEDVKPVLSPPKNGPPKSNKSQKETDLDLSPFNRFDTQQEITTIEIQQVLHAVGIKLEDKAVKEFNRIISTNGFLPAKEIKGHTEKEKLLSSNWLRKPIAVIPTPLDNREENSEGEKSGGKKLAAFFILLLVFAAGVLFYVRPWKSTTDTASRYFCISNNGVLRAALSAYGTALDTLTFGDEVVIQKTIGDWYELQARGKHGYVRTYLITGQQDYDLLVSIFGNDEAKEAISLTRYRRALINYFNKNNYTGKANELLASITGGADKEQWQIFTKNKDTAPNTFIYKKKLANEHANFADFGVIIENGAHDKRKFLLFTFDENENATLVYEQSAPMQGDIASVHKVRSTGDYIVTYTDGSNADTDFNTSTPTTITTTTSAEATPDNTPAPPAEEGRPSFSGPVLTQALVGHTFCGIMCDGADQISSFTVSDPALSAGYWYIRSNFTITDLNTNAFENCSADYKIIKAGASYQIENVIGN